MPGLPCVLLTYCGLQKILFGERISKCFCCRSSLRQCAQSAVKIRIQREPGPELVDVVTALLHHLSYR